VRFSARSRSSWRHPAVVSVNAAAEVGWLDEDVPGCEPRGEAPPQADTAPRRARDDRSQHRRRGGRRETREACAGRGPGRPGPPQCPAGRRDSIPARNAAAAAAAAASVRVS